MTLIIKLSRGGHTRRLMFDEEPTWEEFSTQVSELEHIPKETLAVSVGPRVPLRLCGINISSPGLLC